MSIPNNTANKYDLITDITVRQAEFLYDTLTYFNSSNRGKTGSRCTYVGGCAIGRHLDFQLADKLDNSQSSSVWKMDVYEQLPFWMQEMGRSFLNKIQQLHDSSDFWTPSGFYADYSEDVELIIRKYGLDLKLKYTDTGVVRVNEVNSSAN